MGNELLVRYAICHTVHLKFYQEGKSHVKCSSHTHTHTHTHTPKGHQETCEEEGHVFPLNRGDGIKNVQTHQMEHLN